MRRSRILWGMILILVGVFLLLNTLGLIPRDSWKFFWPAVLIFLGLWFLFGAYLFPRKVEVETLSIPLDGVRQARVRIDHGAGRLELNAAAGPHELISGECYGGVEQEVNRQADHIDLRLRPPMENVIPPFFNTTGFRWQLGLNRGVRLNLELHTGASETELNLGELSVDELRVETGASATRITLPEQAGFTRATIKAGAASVEIQLPQGVAGRIHVESGLAGIKVDTRRFLPRGDKDYESPDYAGAANRAEISIETGVGSVEVR